MTEERQIDYDALLHDALRDAQRSVMRTVLTKVAEAGLPGEHHFYISFNTLAPGVSIAPRLLQKYPAEMTIVLQHRFWDLFVQADRFEVKLTFDGIRERLLVPFSAVRMFFDPSVPYGLQFDEPADGRSPHMGEVVGITGGRAGRASGKTQGERGERPQTDRKKTQRKKPEVVGDQMSADDAPPTSNAIERTGSAGDRVGSDRNGDDKAPSAITPAKGPRLVETANDSAKVVSLDQFRKK
jgi:uncharacterized protein